MKQTGIRFTDAVARALRLAAAKTAQQQQQIIDKAMRKELGYLGDTEIDEILARDPEYHQLHKTPSPE